MLVNEANLRSFFIGLKALFNRGFEGAPSQQAMIAMPVPSSAREEKYGWLADLPRIREWIGDRVVNNLKVQGHSVVNKKFESTISVKRDDIADDQYGVLSPLFEQMGQDARMHPDELVFGLLAAGFTTLCYDGQFFFDTDHPVIDAAGVETSVSNYQAGAGDAWYLLDTSRIIKPLLFQTREKYEFQSLDKPTDENVFMRDEYLYGVRARANAGFSLWQLAYASKADLTADNFGLAKAAMSSLKGDYGKKLGIMPNTLVVPPSLEQKARQLLKSGSRVIDTGDATTTRVAVANEWVGAAELIISPFLA